MTSDVDLLDSRASGGFKILYITGGDARMRSNKVDVIGKLEAVILFSFKRVVRYCKRYRRRVSLNFCALSLVGI